MNSTMLYRCPGKHFAGSGKTYDYISTDNKQQLEDLKAQGWKLSLDEAKNIYEIEEAAKEPEKSEYRLKLETIADKHEVKYNSRTKDETLLDKIKQAAEGK